MEKRNVIGLIVIVVLIAAGVFWYTQRDNKPTPVPVLSVAAFNQTKNKTATELSASPEDTIVYTLTAENTGDELIVGYIIEANISEITDKATLVDASGASYNSATNSLVWTPLDIAPHDSIKQNFSVRVNPVAAGTTSTSLRIKFNNELAISIAPGQLAVVNPVVSGANNNYKAPSTGASEWIPAIFALIATAIFVGIRKYRFVKT